LHYRTRKAPAAAGASCPSRNVRRLGRGADGSPHRALFEGRRDLATLERLFQVLVRRAVVPPRQWVALAGRSLAGVCPALTRLAVERHALRQLLQVCERQLDVPFDNAPDAELIT